MMKHEGERNKVRLEAPVVIIQMKSTIYIPIQTDWMLLEGLLFPGPSGGKYLSEEISREACEGLADPDASILQFSLVAVQPLTSAAVSEEQSGHSQYNRVHPP